MSKSSRFATRAVHAGQAPDPAYGAVMTPVYQTSTYAQDSPGVYQGRYDYSRSANPTRTAFEENIASLEGGVSGISFASGLASISACIHLLESGDHIVVTDDIYGGTFRLLNSIYKKHGIEFTMVDLSDLEATEAAFTPQTKMLWLETPTNPLLKIIDIEALSKLTKSKDVLLAVDNTFLSPYLQNPLALGADIVCHSTTKYLGGHSDLVGGVLVVSDPELAEKLYFIQNAIGAVPAPWECFLLLRSAKTLHLRMERHCDNAMAIAKHLESHSKIEKVIYPGLASHPQHELAKKQMSGFGGMLSIVVSGGLDQAKQLLEKVEIFTLAESLGGVESLIEHPGIMTHASIPAEQREALGIVDGFIRISVGVEDVQDLIVDLEQALA